MLAEYLGLIFGLALLISAFVGLLYLLFVWSPMLFSKLCQKILGKSFVRELGGLGGLCFIFFGGWIFIAYPVLYLIFLIAEAVIKLFGW
jgi:small neutral amino acid transporter SnatA (MarC family)